MSAYRQTIAESPASYRQHEVNSLIGQYSKQRKPQSLRTYFLHNSILTQTKPHLLIGYLAMWLLGWLHTNYDIYEICGAAKIEYIIPTDDKVAILWSKHIKQVLLKAAFHKERL